MMKLAAAVCVIMSDILGIVFRAIVGSTQEQIKTSMTVT